MPLVYIVTCTDANEFSPTFLDTEQSVNISLLLNGEINVQQILNRLQKTNKLSTDLVNKFIQQYYEW